MITTTLLAARYLGGNMTAARGYMQAHHACRKEQFKNETYRYRGYKASKKECFYGFEAEVITTSDGMPVDYFIVAGSMHDAKAFEAMNVELLKGSKLYADSAYTNYELEEMYLECEQAILLSQRKSNSKRKDSPVRAFVKRRPASVALKLPSQSPSTPSHRRDSS